MAIQVRTACDMRIGKQLEGPRKSITRSRPLLTIGLICMIVAGSLFRKRIG